MVIVTSVFGIFLVSLFHFFYFSEKSKFPKTFQTLKKNPKKWEWKIQVEKKIKFYKKTTQIFKGCNLFQSNNVKHSYVTSKIELPSRLVVCKTWVYLGPKFVSCKDEAPFSNGQNSLSVGPIRKYWVPNERFW